MTVWVVEFDHQDGLEIWVATSDEVAQALVAAVQQRIFKSRDPEDAWPFYKAKENWSEYSGNTEFFRINEVSLVDTAEAARKAAI